MLQLRSESSDKPPLWLVGPVFRIGSQRDSQIRLDKLAEIALELAVVDQEVTIAQCSGEVAVNGKNVESGEKLKHGDTLKIESHEWSVFDPKSLSKANTVMRKPIILEWHLIGLSPEIVRKKFDIKGPVTIGRAPECEISLNHQELSRKHVKLSPTASGLVVEDLGSSNGTYINGERTEHATVASGAEIRLDTVSFKIMGPATDGAGASSTSKEDLDATKMRGTVPMRSVKKPSVPTKPAVKPVKPSTAPQPSKASNQAGTTASSSASEASSSAKKSSMRALLLLVLLGAGVYAAHHFNLIQLPI